MAPLFPDHRRDDVRLAWVLGPIALLCLVAATVTATLGGSIAVFGTLAFTSISLGLTIVTIRMMTLTGRYAPLHQRRELPVVRSVPPVDYDIGAADSTVTNAATTAPPRELDATLLAGLPPERFEAICIEYFKRLGFRASIRAGLRGEGVDIRLHLAAAAGGTPVNLVRCRAPTQPIGVNDIREFMAAMGQHRVPRGIYVSAQGFRSSARGLAEQNRIFVMSAADLVAKIHERPATEQARCAGSRSRAKRRSRRNAAGDRPPRSG